MASPDHKAGLAVVVPPSDNRSQPRGKVKQNVFSSHRKPLSQSMGSNGGRQSQGTFNSSRYPNGLSSPQKPNGVALVRHPNGNVPRQTPVMAGSQQSNGGSLHQASHATLPKSNGLADHQAKGGISARPRLLGVEEALQYSPFSSIVPFSSDVIPIPDANVPGSQPIFPIASEQRTARQSLEVLDEELRKAPRHSNIAERARLDLKAYLDQDVITDFKFKRCQRPRDGQGHAGAKKGSFGSGQAPIVGPFAKMMLQATDLADRYPTPKSAGQTLPTKPHIAPVTISSQAVEIPPNPPKTQQVIPGQGDTAQIARQHSPVTPLSQRFVHNDAAFSRNGIPSVKSHSTYTPTHPQPTPMVVIPVPSVTARSNDFVTYEEPSVKGDTGAIREFKRDSEARLGPNSSQMKDPRAASDEILCQLQCVIQEIFTAEDQLQTDSSGGISCINNQYLVSVLHEEREIVTLSPATHVRLESLLHKLTKIGRFGDVSVEYLQRLQRLCEGPMNYANDLDLQLNEDWDTEGFASWISKLDAADAGLRSARTILRIMTGGREERQLYSEELLQSLFGAVKGILDNVIVPVVEARSSGSTSSFFEGVSTYKKVISQLLSDVTKVMAMLANLLAKAEMAEIIVTGIEFLATALLFVENSHSERDSILGIYKFESLRRTAMNQISTIFLRYPEQRIFLLNEILTSLKKLPVNEKHARQFKLAEGKTIMLVSALIIELVQISARRSSAAKKPTLRQRKSRPSKNQESRSQSSGDESPVSTSSREESNELDLHENTTSTQNGAALHVLSRDANLLVDNATKSAQYVITFLMQRASNIAKTSESPHRQHLDIFVQDLITVLGIPEWPAAELLLRMVFASCRNIAENPKSLAPAKNMALEILGMLGSAISDLVSSTRHASKSLNHQDSDFSGYLQRMFYDYMEGSLEGNDLVMWDGPYHAIVEYLETKSSDDTQNTNAQAYYLAQWAKAVISGDLKADPESEKLVLKLHKLVSGASRDISETPSTLTSNQSRVAYALTILNMGFCRQSDYILKILLDSVTSEQITVRTRSLKSVDRILEGNPSALDRARNVKVLITNCANDASSMVRDSALTLIGKCITLRPILEQEFLRVILKLTDDPAAGVRKRSMKMLKEIYLRNSCHSVKTAIGDNLLLRVKDLDSSVADLACQILEDIWLSPFWNVPDLGNASAQNKVDFRNQTSLIVGTVRRSEKVAAVLADLLKTMTTKGVRNAAVNFEVCRSLVATAFDLMIDNFENPERLEQRQILQTLTVFATANAMLFTPDQLQSLQPYITNLSGKDDLEAFRSIVIIFRCVLPVQSNVQHGLLREIQKALLQSISKLGKAELNEVAGCLWTINSTLQNPEMLLRLTISVLKNLRNFQDDSFTETDRINDLKRVKKYIQIAGFFGKHCDFEKHIQTIQTSLTWWKGQSVAELFVKSISPFTADAQPLSLKAEAFDSVGLICQSWPYQFTQEQISNTFQGILRKGEPELQTIVLSSFRDFFSRINRQAETKDAKVLELVNAPSGEKLGGSMTANEGDGASALIAQRFLKDILRIALASQDASALTATEVMASINRQGLVHPKESGPALVALETSTNPAIAKVAFQEHRLLHQQHESMFEREYMRAIQEAFNYQRNIVGDPLGYTTRPYASKLSAMFEVIKTSKGKYQKKFLTNYCSKIDFDVLKMDLSGTTPKVLQFSRFLTENLAFFDYGRLDELLHTITCMEKIVADTGSGIAHSISIDVFNITIESMPGATVPGASSNQGLANDSKFAVDPSRLRQLATASIILGSLWETRTYLRRLYGLTAGQQKRDGKNKPAAKDLNKAPGRVQGVTGEKLVTSIAEKVTALDSEVLMTQQCKEFVELLSVDNEVKVAAEGEEHSERLETPSGDEDEQDTPMSGRSQGVKRKSSVSAAGTPGKKKKGRPSLQRRRSGKSVGSEEDWE